MGGTPAERPVDPVFGGDLDVGRDLTAVDWTATGLGPPGRWPQGLRSAVGIVLSSRFAMWMLWGPRRTFFCNAAYRRDTLGRKYPWALGRPADEVWSEVWQDVAPRVEAVLTTGVATWDEDLLLFLERSGYQEETYHTFSYSPLHDDDGSIAGMLCVVQENTDRVIAARQMATLRDLGADTELARSDSEVLEFVGTQLDRNRRDLPFTAIYLVDEDGTARLADVGTSGATRRRMPPVITADGTDSWPLPDPARDGSAVVDLDDGFPAGDWPLPPVRALVLPLRRQGGGTYGHLVVGVNRYRPLDEHHRGFLTLVADRVAAVLAGARDHQAQQRRNEELAALDEAKTTFFFNVSHEFRTPLALILGPLRTLLDGSAVDAAARADLAIAHRNALRLNGLVNTLLEFARIEAGRTEHHRVPVDVAVLTAELASMFRSAADRAGLELVIDCRPVGRPVPLDPTMWEGVVFNLLSNALKFTFEGRITVTVDEVDDQVEVRVADTGVGVPEHEVPRLFERFHRVPNTRGRSAEGSGIGLAFVAGVVGLHGGTVAVDSAVDHGTTVTIRLPITTGYLPPEPCGGDPDPVRLAPAGSYVRDVPPGSPRDEPTGAPARSAGLAVRILVADDNADMRDYLRRLLTAAGHQVETVADGRLALDSARASVPDLVVSDVMMPALDGLELARLLRTDAATSAVPVILLSARCGRDDSVTGLRAGADDYLTKPFDAAELLARVDTTVRLARLRSRQARWRAALVDTLTDGFFVCDDVGTVVEINAAFTELFGYGPGGLPYRAAHPWWPDVDVDAEAHRQVVDAFAEALGRDRGVYTLPMMHRDGHQLWCTVTFSKACDPDTGRDVIVGMLRDVTADTVAARRADALGAFGAALSQVSGVDDTLAAALTQLRTVWAADRVLAVSFDGQSTAESPAEMRSTDGSGWRQIPLARRRALVDLASRPPLVPHVDQAGLGTVLEYPNGRIVVWVDTAGRPGSPDDGLTLAVLAGRLAEGLTRGHRADLERETAVALQRAILVPAQLPDGFAARYLPATRRLEVGGDWYDIVALDGGRYGLVVGDCVGHGLTSATVMGQLRSACRALMLRDASPAATLTALDDFAATVADTLCTTVFCGVLDPGAGRLTYASAGHPPAIVVDADGRSRLLDRARSLPLAVRSGAVRSEAEYVLPPRSTVLLYTDGLVERRSGPLSAGQTWAGRFLADHGDLFTDETASGLLTELRPPGGYEDDVALLLFRQPGPLDISFPADPNRLAGARGTVGQWLERCGVSPVVAQDVLLAVNEACTNAVEHGCRGDSAGDVTVRAETTAARIRIVVTDRGSWKEPSARPDSARGRGIVLMRAVMDRVEIVRGPDGTCVEMTARV